MSRRKRGGKSRSIANTVLCGNVGRVVSGQDPSYGGVGWDWAAQSTGMNLLLGEGPDLFRCTDAPWFERVVKFGGMKCTIDFAPNQLAWFGAQG